MKLEIEKNNEEINIKVYGTLDTMTTEEFLNQVNELELNNKKLFLDFENLTYITSAGLRALLIIRKKLSDETFIINNVNSEVEEIFKMTGFSSILNYNSKNINMEITEEDNYVSILRKRVNATPNNVIYVYKDREYTWKEIDMASQIIANDLYKMGVKKGTHVGICSPNNINWIFIFYAVQKLGGIAVLINNELKINEINIISEIGDVEYICYGYTSKDINYSIFEKNIKRESVIVKATYNISENIDFTTRYSEYEDIQNEFNEIYNADDPSVIIFTSGSSGKPKAVLSSAYNCLTSISEIKNELRITSQDRNCAFLPFFHVFGLAMCISLSLLENYPSYIPINKHPNTILDIIDKYKCTLFGTVPTMILAMVQMPEFNEKRVESLRLTILGGSCTSESQMLKLQKLFPNNHFANVYGMSENATISITLYEDSIKHITTTVGKPFPKIDVEIHDLETGDKLTNGQTGEICIRSNTMIVCYYKLDITKQPIDENGWLKTGDLGYIDDDGYLYIVGRAKDLIIRGGENISPSEVAEAISKLDEIADVKVLGIPHEIFGEEVAAAVILKPNMKFNENNREILKERVANYKIPTYFVIMDEFPVLGSGKIDAIKIKEQVIQEIKNNKAL